MTENKDEAFLDENYKKCLSHVFCKLGNFFFLTRKDYDTDEMKDTVANFKKMDVPYFNFWIYETTGDVRYLSYSPKIESLNKELFSEYKKKKGVDYSPVSGDNDLLTKIKEEICKKEGIEM